MRLHWLCRLIQKRTVSSRPFFRRPAVELLEDRTLPAPFNEPPVLAVNAGLNVPQPGATQLLTPSQLQATDTDSPLTQIYFKLKTLPVNGSLLLNGTVLAVGDTFTQQDIQDGRVRYTHNGSTTTTDQFTFDLSNSPFWSLELVSRAPDGLPGDSFGDFRPAISADGRQVAFVSTGSNIVPGDTNNAPDAFLYDRQTRQVQRVSVGLGGAEPNAGVAGLLYARIDVAMNGQSVAFISSASNLVPGDSNAVDDAFVYQVPAGPTTRVSVATNGTPTNGSIGEVALSADGRFVVMGTGASNLVPGDTNGRPDIFVHDLLTGGTERVSVASDGTQHNGLTANQPAISADGRYVAFRSTAANLVPGDTNSRADVFVHDRQTGQTTRVSVDSSGPDPLLFLPRTLRAQPGETITVPVLLDRSEGLHSADLALSYDARRLELVEVRRGGLTADFDLFLVNADAGTIRVGLGRSAGPVEDRGGGFLLDITFRIRENAHPEKTIINLRHEFEQTVTQLNEGGLDLHPDPDDRAGDRLDGIITLLPARRVDEFFRQPGAAPRTLDIAAWLAKELAQLTAKRTRRLEANNTHERCFLLLIP